MNSRRPRTSCPSATRWMAPTTIWVNGDVVIAAITSCTNTSNPSGDDRRRAAWRETPPPRGLKVKPWVKTSLAPGSQVVTEYLKRAGLQKDLNKLGFDLVGYGCTTCIGNSGPLPEPISNAIQQERHRRLLGAVGQPQFRRPDLARHSRQLSGLTSAGGRLRARRLDAGRPDE